MYDFSSKLAHSDVTIIWQFKHSLLGIRRNSVSLIPACLIRTQLLFIVRNKNNYIDGIRGRIVWCLKPKLVHFVDAPGNEVNASMPEQLKRSNPWRNMMMIMIMMMMMMVCACSVKRLITSHLQVCSVQLVTPSSGIIALQQDVACLFSDGKLVFSCT
jgi:hypothetical protein